MRIGHGYDVHKLGPSSEASDPSIQGVILGGVVIPHDKVLIGHSDADVLIHAIIDALLGAAGLADIGSQFPPSDNQYKGISSLKLLEHVKALLEGVNGRSFSISNIDATVVAQAPKIKSHIPAMRENISRVLGIELDQINIKATTTEKLGFTGRGEGIASEAVCLLKDN